MGRNGSGKSTLLKIMSSIYKADAGTIRVAGRLAPFIELGVGFNPELTSRENVVLNGVMMGLGRARRARRLDAVLDFAELREFADLKLKNYSSGMMVRLAFAVMVEADADVMLVDEVLAVGDAAFGQHCMDVFHARRRAGKTLVLVTHDMSTVESLCDRAMLIDEGEMRYLGDPGETAMRYYRVNFAGDHGARASDAQGTWDVNVRSVDAWLEGAGGERLTAVEERDPMRVQILLEARRDLEAPVFAVHVYQRAGAGGVRVQPHAHARRRGDRRGGGGQARSAVRRDREPPHAGALLRALLRRPQPRAGRHRAAPAAPVRLRRLRPAALEGERDRRRRRGGHARAMTDASLELRDVRGPSALGGGWRRVFDLLWLIGLTEFRRTYLGTALGYLWSLARPLMLFGVLLVVFTQAFDLGERVNEYPVLLLFNIVLFGFFQESTVMAVGSIVAQESVVRKTQFPRLVIPLAVVLTALFNLGANLVVVSDDGP